MDKNEIKIRFFAAHLGANAVITEDGEKYYGIVHSVCPKSYKKVILLSGHNDLVPDKLDDVQLILTPLSDITDEHAIEVAKIYSHIPTPGGSINKNSPIDKIRKMLIWHAPHRGDVVDYLRSLNYCLPFMGLDPIKEGWAILDNQKS